MFQRNFRKLWSILFILLLFTHMKMKKMLLGAFLGMFALAGVAVLPNYASADSGTVSTVGDHTWDDPKGNNMISNKAQAGWQLLTTIKTTINWLLGILATVAVAICLYGGFLMMTSAGDEKKYEKGLTVLKYAAIGLAIIGLSWIIVSAVFWFVNLQWGGQDIQTIS